MQSVPRVRDIVTFVVVAIALAWLVALPLWLNLGLANPLAPVLLVVMMFTPAAAAVFIVLVVARGPSPLSRLGILPVAPLRRTIVFSVVGLIGSILLVATTVAISAALGLVRLDLLQFSGFGAQLAALAASAPGAGQLPPIGLLVVLQLIALPIGGIVNGLFAVGEEVGWRGYLLPALMARMGTPGALLVSGAIWGLWHAPVILLGYDFGRADPVGVVLMVVACMLLGVLFGWLRIAGGNIWPAVFAHGGLNAAAGLLTLLVAAGERPDPAVVGPLGYVAWGVMAAIILVAVLVRRIRRVRVRPDVTAA